MSLNKMLQSNENQDSSDDSPKRLGKVKVFYSFKDSDVTCLCTFDTYLPSTTDDNEHWIPISLKQCLLSVCSSCPDQLMRAEYDMAIYSANIEESNISHQESLKDVRTTVIWEGHGLLSNLVRERSNENIMVTGQLSKTSGESFDYVIQVLLQLHPIRRPPSSEQPASQQQQQQQQSQHTLPPMKSLLAPDHHTYSPYPSSSTSSPPYQHHPTAISSSQPPRLPAFRPFASSQPPLRSELDFIPPLASSPYHSTPQAHKRKSSSEWPRYISPTPHPYDERTNRKLSPPLPSSSTHALHQPSTYHPSYSHPSHPFDSSTGPDHPSSSSTSSTPPPPASTITTGSSINAATRKTPVDTFYHQSRRKKRDTKPPNASDVRPFIEVDRDLHGHYILPVEVDSWTVLDLGTVVWDRVAFHNQRYLYPVGYCVKKWYRSMVDPHSDTQYTCQILDGGDEPIFQLEADDNPGEVWRGPTPTTVWTIAVRRAFAIRNMDYGHNPVGPDFFGLRKNTIAKMIQDLPNADKCKNYIWQNFEAITTTGTKNKAMRRSNTRVSTSSSSTSTSSINEPTQTTAPATTPLPQPASQQHSGNDETSE